MLIQMSFTAEIKLLRNLALSICTLFSSAAYAGDHDNDKADCRAELNDLITEYNELENYLVDIVPPIAQLKGYAAEYEAVIDGTNATPTNTIEMLSASLDATVTLVGDDHGIKQSTDFFLFMMDGFIQSHRKPAIVVEFVFGEDQEILDSYLDGEISLEEFKKYVRFIGTKGGLKWNQISRILIKAKEHGLDVIAAEEGSNNLNTRDIYIAERIKEDFDKRGKDDRQYLVFYGGVHMVGEDHLLDEVERRGFADTVTILAYVMRSITTFDLLMSDCEMRQMKLSDKLYFSSARDEVVDEMTHLVEHYAYFKKMMSSRKDAAVSEDERVKKFFDQSFKETKERNPIFAEYIGEAGIYDQWRDMSEEFVTGTHELKQIQYQELLSYDRDKLSKASQVSYDLFVYDSERAKNNHRFRYHHYPISQFASSHSEPVVHLQNVHKVDSELTAEAYITRLYGIDGFLQQYQEFIDKRLSKGMSLPYFAVESVIPSIEKILVGKPFQPEAEEDASLLATFKNKLSTVELDELRKADLISKTEQALVESVKPAYERFVEFISPIISETSGVEAKGVWALPDGDDFYRSLLKYHTTTDMSAQEIHELGLSEVARLHKEVERVMADVGFDGSLKEFFEYTVNDASFYYEKSDQGREQAIADAERYINGMHERLDEAFITLPKTGVEVKAVPSFMEATSGIAFYTAGSTDGSRPGTYYINLYNPKELPKWQMAAIAYHEALPGHHMQFSIAQNLGELPDFRRYGSYTAFSEGWGLYSELMPKEMGFYTDPYDEYGRLVMELLRACRLVADTGIHYKRWTEAEAIEFILENMPFTPERATRSVRRYFVMPGQATAYKIGQIKILQLRDKAKKQLGELFDIREFNEAVLTNGSVPLHTLEVLLDDWARSKISNNNNAS